jgi:hypothetical protein
MIAARSRGLSAIAVPGADGWRSEWAALLAGRDVSIVMDADTAGRRAAQRIAHDLAGHCQARIVELAAARADGHDLTDWLSAQPDLPSGAIDTAAWSTTCWSSTSSWRRSGTRPASTRRARRSSPSTPEPPGRAAPTHNHRPGEEPDRYGVASRRPSRPA